MRKAREDMCHPKHSLDYCLMQLILRPIRPEEIPEASHLVDAAYEPQIREIYGENSPLGKWRHYEESKIESYVEREPDGVRVGV
jgi:hypothetical protein